MIVTLNRIRILGARIAALAVLSLTLAFPIARGTAQSARPPIADGQAAAKRVWDTVLTKCGSSYLYGGSTLMLIGHGAAERSLDPGSDFHGRWLWEYRDVTFKYASLQLSQADRLNRIDQKGIASLIPSAWRERGDDGKWGEWRPADEVGGHSGRIRVLIKRIEGRWVYLNANHFTEDYPDESVLGSKIAADDLKTFTKPSCSLLIGE